MNVAILTIEQKEQLVGQQYANDSYFNPIQDVTGNWVISEEEINFCTNDNFSWIKNLELEDYKPINNDL